MAQGYATAPGSGLFEVARIAGETRRICGVTCVWLQAANGAGYFGDLDGLRVSAIEARGGWFVSIASARLTFTAYVADLSDAAVAS